MFTIYFDVSHVTTSVAVNLKKSAESKVKEKLLRI